MPTYPDEGLINEFQLIAGSGGANLYVRLFSNNPTISHATVLTDLVEPSFTGYAPKNVSTWTAPFVDTNGDVVIQSPVFIFTGPSSGPGDTIKGWFVTYLDGSSEKLFAAHKLTAGIPLNVLADQYPLRINLRKRALAA